MKFAFKVLLIGRKVRYTNIIKMRNHMENLIAIINKNRYIFVAEHGCPINNEYDLMEIEVTKK